MARHSERTPHSRAASVCGISCALAGQPASALGGGHTGGRFGGSACGIQSRRRPCLTCSRGAFDSLEFGDALDQRRFIGRRADRRHTNIDSIVNGGTDTHRCRYPGGVPSRNRIRLARVYDDVGPDDGQRVLVDRVWPRGLRKDDPRVGIWCRDVAPSGQLREWYHHQRELFDEFAARYRAELRDSAALAELRTLAEHGVLTLVTATRDLDISQAAVLAKLLQEG